MNFEYILIWLTILFAVHNYTHYKVRSIIKRHQAWEKYGPYKKGDYLGLIKEIINKTDNMDLVSELRVFLASRYYVSAFFLLTFPVAVLLTLRFFEFQR